MVAIEGKERVLKLLVEEMRQGGWERAAKSDEIDFKGQGIKREGS